MEPHTAQVQAAVQQLLMEHGEYVPLELLLATNRLAYEDYRAWREGRLETLDAVLADGQRESCAWLEAAQSWACALGRTAEPAVHHSWAENAGTGLVASIDPRLNALLSTRFRRTPEHDQLDLFIDSAQTAAVNALVDALAVRNVGEARGALDRLERITPTCWVATAACTEPSRVRRRFIRLNHPAVTGVENRVSRLRSADATTSHAGTRSTVPGSVARHPDSRHGCATARRALTRGACALMTDSERHPVTAASLLPADPQFTLPADEAPAGLRDRLHQR